MIEKYLNGETVQDYRKRRRDARKSGEQSVKTTLRVRDGIGCRWPDCQYWKRGYRVEGAHLDDKGMGGDPKLIRTVLAEMMRLCVKHHQGPLSLHSKDLKIEYLTERKANGPCAFYYRDDKAPNGWAVAGIEDDFTFKQRENLAAEDGDD